MISPSALMNSERAVDRAMRERVALDHPDRDVDAGLAGRRAELVGLGAGHVDRRLDVLRLEMALLGRTERRVARTGSSRAARSH